MTKAYGARELAEALRGQPKSVSRQARGIMARHLDQAAVTAQSRARSEWGERSSISTIRARMSATIGTRGGSRQVGYLLADGPGAFFAEHGHHHVPPRPVVRQSAEDAMAAMLGDIADAATNL